MSTANSLPARIHSDRAAWTLPAHRLEEREEEPPRLSQRDAERLVYGRVSSLRD